MDLGRRDLGLDFLYYWTHPQLRDVVMPYIHPHARRQWIRFLQPLIDQISGETEVRELNYLITSILAKACSTHLNARTPAYHEINKAVGVLECAKLELYRRLGGPGKDLKWQQHGDVY